MELTKESLDRFVPAGCAAGCDHEPNAHEMFLHSRCHVRAPMFVDSDREPGSLVLSCVECSTPALVVKYAGAKPDVRLTCCNDGWDTQTVWASYRAGSGLLKLSCYFCKATAIEVPVAAGDSTH